jgi:hypothetical protein
MLEELTIGSNSADLDDNSVITSTAFQKIITKLTNLRQLVMRMPALSEISKASLVA